MVYRYHIKKLIFFICYRSPLWAQAVEVNFGEWWVTTLPMMQRSASLTQLESRAKPSMTRASSTGSLAASALLSMRPILHKKGKGKGKPSEEDIKKGEDLLLRMQKPDDVPTGICIPCWQRRDCPIHSDGVLSGYGGRATKIRLFSRQAIHFINAVEGGPDVSNALIQQMKAYKEERRNAKGKGKGMGKGGSKPSSPLEDW